MDENPIRTTRTFPLQVHEPGQYNSYNSTHYVEFYRTLVMYPSDRLRMAIIVSRRVVQDLGNVPYSDRLRIEIGIGDIDFK
jgi:hypothetical protein